jgi:hypothetical protein
VVQKPMTATAAMLGDQAGMGVRRRPHHPGILETPHGNRVPHGTGKAAALVLGSMGSLWADPAAHGPRAAEHGQASGAGDVQKMRSAIPRFFGGVTRSRPGEARHLRFMERKPERNDLIEYAAHQSPTVWQILERHGKRCRHQRRIPIRRSRCRAS